MIDDYYPTEKEILEAIIKSRGVCDIAGEHLANWRELDCMFCPLDCNVSLTKGVIVEPEERFEKAKQMYLKKYNKEDLMEILL